MANVLKRPEKSARPFTVIVEGNIGSGKTTLLEYFSKYDDVSIFAEPVERWRNCNGHNLLQLLYDDTKKWAFTFESYVLQTMIQQHTKITDKSIKLMERSIYSARYCFIEKMIRDGNLSPPSTVVLDELYKWLCENADVGVDLVVYLRTSPEVVYERMIKRDRNEERDVPLEYLKDLHEYYENWLYRKNSFSCPAPVITINADLDISGVLDEYEKCKSSILHKSSTDVRI